MAKALCGICNLPVGSDENEHPGAAVYHMACSMEVCYGSRGENPTEGAYAESYKRACEKRAEQVRES